MTSRILPLFTLLLLVACQSKPSASTAIAPGNSADADRFHKAGLVLLPDLEHASNWEKLIHVDMGVPASKIDVQAGPGFTTVTIKDLKNRADIEGVAQELRTVAEKQPGKFGPTKVEVRLNNAPATINPFALPTASAPLTPPMPAANLPMAAPSTASPDSALPTLSLPPLRSDGR